MYTYFFGNRMNESFTQAKFDQAGVDGPWGWTVADCAGGYNYICKVKSSDWACYPPPTPAPPLPSPPSPPIPPNKASCECPQPGATSSACRLLASGCGSP
jgi:hypothetical protein